MTGQESSRFVVVLLFLTLVAFAFGTLFESCLRKANAAPVPAPRARPSDKIPCDEWVTGLKCCYWDTHNKRVQYGRLFWSESWDIWFVSYAGPPDFAGLRARQLQRVGTRGEEWIRVYRTSQSAEKYR